MNTTSKSSGLKTADGVIATGKTILTGVQVLSNLTADATLVLYDNATAASGNELFKVQLSGTLDSTYYSDINVRCDNGIYADVTGAGAAYIVHFK